MHTASRHSSIPSVLPALAALICVNTVAAEEQRVPDEIIAKVANAVLSVEQRFEETDTHFLGPVGLLVPRSNLMGQPTMTSRSG